MCTYWQQKQYLQDMLLGIDARVQRSFPWQRASLIMHSAMKTVYLKFEFFYKVHYAQSNQERRKNK